MQLRVKHIWQVVFLVVVFGQVALLFRAIRRPALAWIVNPADDVIEVCLLADLLKICCERAAESVVIVAN